LFRAGSYGRLAAPLALVTRLEEFPPERIERSDGRAAVQYRGQILPLAMLAPMLDPGASSAIESGAPVAVVVVGDGEEAIGLVVDEILDLVETEVAVRRHAPSSMLCGSAVVNGKVTDFLDLPAVVRACGRHSGPGAAELLRQLRALPTHADVPVIALTGECAFDAYQPGIDRDSLLASLDKLAQPAGPAAGSLAEKGRS
jgi:CheY-like chemotaxis protein